MTSWDFSGSFDEGVFMAGFYRFFWELRDMPGYFLVFAGGSTRKQASNDIHDIIFIPGAGLSFDRGEEQPWDIAAYLYQVFWQAEGNPNRKATFFLGGTGGPDDPQFGHWNIFAAIEAFGLTKRRQDRMGVAGWYNPLSKNFIKDTALAGISLRDTWGVEVYYNIALNKWLHVTPDLQIAQNEREADDVAVIPGLRFVIDF